MKHSKELKAKFIQGVLGFTCGDALGVPVEFSPREKGCFFQTNFTRRYSNIITF